MRHNIGSQAYAESNKTERVQYDNSRIQHVVSAPADGAKDNTGSPKRQCGNRRDIPEIGRGKPAVPDKRRLKRHPHTYHRGKAQSHERHSETVLVSNVPYIIRCFHHQPG